MATVANGSFLDLQNLATVVTTQGYCNMQFLPKTAKTIGYSSLSNKLLSVVYKYHRNIHITVALIHGYCN